MSGALVALEGWPGTGEVAPKKLGGCTVFGVLYLNLLAPNVMERITNVANHPLTRVGAALKR
jgi:hypothetical protein